MSRKYTIHVQPEAESNMEDAYQWLLEKAPAYAADWFHNLVREFHQLEVHSENFRWPLRTALESLIAKCAKCSTARDTGSTGFCSLWREISSRLFT